VGTSATKGIIKAGARKPRPDPLRPPPRSLRRAHNLEISLPHLGHLALSGWGYVRRLLVIQFEHSSLKPCQAAFPPRSATIS
jgi:hypothetical protein